MSAARMAASRRLIEGEGLSSMFVTCFCRAIVDESGRCGRHCGTSGSGPRIGGRFCAVLWGAGQPKRRRRGPIFLTPRHQGIDEPDSLSEAIEDGPVLGPD